MQMPTDFGRRIKQARKHAKLTQKQLAPLAGMSQSNLSELETVAHESGKTVQLAAAMGVDAHWLATGEGSMLPALRTGEATPHWMQNHPSSEGAYVVGRGVSLAQQLSHPSLPNAPIAIDWSRLLSSPLPDQFVLTVRDDAMVLTDPPSMMPGDLAIFAKCDTATPGQVVLLADSEGNVYIRRYLQRTPTRWAAVARNDAYEPLDSERDGLRVLAVQIGWMAGKGSTAGA